ncbi:hypothetical protein N7540_004849 [Penicillium herquei]|nr:hypothetical protein N7540_004849 [Penicillium herquei]
MPKSDQSSTIGDCLMRCQKAGEFSDLLLVCEGHEFKVHKFVVCSQVQPIHAACTKGFKETNTGIYEFEDESHIVVLKAISYLYTQSYNESQEQELEGDDNASQRFSRLQLHARVFAFADRYCIPNLMSFSATMFKSRLACIRAQPPMTDTIHGSRAERAKGVSSFGISPDIIEFLDSVPAVFNLTPESTTELRDACLDFAHDKLPFASIFHGFQGPYENMLLEVPSFAKGLIDRLFLSARARLRLSVWVGP